VPRDVHARRRGAPDIGLALRLIAALRGVPRLWRRLRSRCSETATASASAPAIALRPILVAGILKAVQLPSGVQVPMGVWLEHHRLLVEWQSLDAAERARAAWLVERFPGEVAALREADAQVH
jgi:hypothetical protein